MIGCAEQLKGRMESVRADVLRAETAQMSLTALPLSHQRTHAHADMAPLLIFSLYASATIRCIFHQTNALPSHRRPAFDYILYNYPDEHLKGLC